MRFELSQGATSSVRKVGERTLDGGVLSIWEGPEHYYGTVEWSDGNRQWVERSTEAGEVTQLHYSQDHVVRSAGTMRSPSSRLLEMVKNHLVQGCRAVRAVLQG